MDSFIKSFKNNKKLIKKSDNPSRELKIEYNLLMLGYLFQMIKILSEFRIKDFTKQNKNLFAKPSSKSFILALIMTDQYQMLIADTGKFLLKTRSYYDKLVKRIDFYPSGKVFLLKAPKFENSLQEIE